MLIAARDKYSAGIDIASTLAADGSEEVEEQHGNIAALFEESDFHNTREIEGGGLIDEDTCSGFGYDTPDILKQVLYQCIFEAVKNGLSNTGEKKVRNVI